MDVELEKEEDVETVQAGEDSTVRDVLEEVGVDPETVLVEVDGRIVPLEEDTEDVDSIRVLEAVSGG